MHCSCTKTAELIEMPFGGWLAWVQAPRSHKLDGSWLLTSPREGTILGVVRPTGKHRESWLQCIPKKDHSVLNNDWSLSHYIIPREKSARLRCVRSFVCWLVFFSGRGPAHSGPQRWDLYIGPMRQPRERRGIGRCVRCTCALCRVEEKTGVSSLPDISKQAPFMRGLLSG